VVKYRVGQIGVGKYIGPFVGRWLSLGGCGAWWGDVLRCEDVGGWSILAGQGKSTYPLSANANVLSISFH
jgi:hypothetical protein